MLPQLICSHNKYVAITKMLPVYILMLATVLVNAQVF